MTGIVPAVPARPGRLRRAVAAGLVLFVAGLVFIALDVLPFFDGRRDTPLWLNLCCLLAPLGFAIAVWAGLAAGRQEQRDAVRGLTDRRAIH